MLVKVGHFVKTKRSVLPAPEPGEPALSPSQMDEAELLPYAQEALRRFIAECIVASVGADADITSAAVLAAAESQMAVLQVNAEVLP